MLEPGAWATFVHSGGTTRYGCVKYQIDEGCVIRRTDRYGNPMALPMEEIHDADWVVREEDQ